MTNDIRLWLYPGANPNSTPDLWGQYETEITQYIRRPGQDGGAAIQYSWGKQDESTQTDAGQMTLTLDNRDGRFSTDKIDGPYYGLLDINTPIRLGVTAAKDNFNRTVTGAVGAAAGWLTSSDGLGVWGNSSLGPGTNIYAVDGAKGTITSPTVNAAAVSLLTGADSRDVDMVTTVYPVVTAVGASYGAGHVVRYTDSNNFVFSTVEFNTAGNVTIKIRRNYLAAQTELASSNPIPSSTYTAGTPWKIRTQMDGDICRVKAWPAAGTEPAAWMISCVEGDNSGTGVGIWAVRFTGNTNTSGNVYVAVDDLTITGLEWTGYVVSWPLRWDMTSRNSWAPITAAGILRRLRQGSNPVQSPLRRQLAGTANVAGYWPMEEGSDAKYFLGTTPGSNVASFSLVTPAADTTLPGGGPAPVLSDNAGSIFMQAKVGNGGTGFAAMFLFKLPSMPATKTLIARIRTSRGPVSIWDLSVDVGFTYVEGKAGDNTVLTSVTNAIVEDWTNWIAWQLETDNNNGAGPTSYAAIYHAVGKTDYWAQSGSIAGGTNSVVSTMKLTGIQGTAFAHAWLGQNTLPFVTNTFSLVSSGFKGELAAARFTRVCGEAGLACSIAGASSLATEAMGPQREATTLAVLQSCVDADYGVLTERGSGVELVPRASRWNLAQTVALSVAAGQISEVPQPTRDDQRLRNKWTVSRNDGGSSSFQDDASVARNGTWEDSAQLNVFDDSVLENHAAWRVNIGIQHRLRWPSFSISLARSPELKVAWRKRFYGWRLGITTGLTQVSGNEPDVVMEGYQATLTPELWDIEMNATDGRVWTAAVTDDTGIYGRADNEACTTTSSLTASATGAVLAVTTDAAYPKWDNTAGLWSGGVDLNVGGERVTVNALANGAGQAQTFTITARGVGGYAAAHAAGTPVSLWFPAIVAL